ncbi:MAG: 30S ribosomal protein S11 [Crenarchaeota archaeon]|nr:30S ribosomal protein S11 [Thermoproteota archaeon]MCR8453580.1 30S ribosomal protein S11 [Thermoproteota archaeon]MCR8454777.1 30S ribosomal protein S11 [Thermoproteota archaeon]MCR8462669.1 30S ribosomal protein S11 [Thermoproteota archaeon]MCR8470288.1 30S ribosomal protein S11 [Thermoproteota archaeon]
MSENAEESEEEVKKTPEEAEAKAEVAALPADPLKIGIAYLFCHKNNTLLTITDATGAISIARASGGLFAETARDEPTPWVALMVGRHAAQRARELGISKVMIKLRGRGGNRSPNINSASAAAAIKSIARAGLQIISIDDVTPIPHDSIRRPGGRRGRRV